MKNITYMVEPTKSIWGCTITILDREAAMESLTKHFTGFTVGDAVENANHMLERFGYRVTREATVEEIDEWL